MDNQLPVDKFVEIYQQLDSTNLDLLSDIYCDNIQFMILVIRLIAVTMLLFIGLCIMHIQSFHQVKLSR